MPRYYFHVLNGKEIIDDQGLELADLDAARLEAVSFAGEVLKSDKPIDIWDGISWELKVMDGPSPYEGRTHLTLTVTANTGRA